MRVENGVGVITLDSPGVKMNSLNEEVMRDVESIFNECIARSDVQAMVIISGTYGEIPQGQDSIFVWIGSRQKSD